MNIQSTRAKWLKTSMSFLSGLYGVLSCRAYSVIMFGALFSTLAGKFFHSYRVGLLEEYFRWIFSDVAVLMGIELVLAVVCFCKPTKAVIRTITFIAALVCTWSVINVGWLVRTGTQVLPTVFVPLFRDPLTALGMVGINLIKMPVACVSILLPSAIALTFFFSVLARPVKPCYKGKSFTIRIFFCAMLAAGALWGNIAMAQSRSTSIAGEDMRYNCQVMAVKELVWPDSDETDSMDIANSTLKIQAFDEVQVGLPGRKNENNYNIVLIILEGVQYKYTSLYDKDNGLTPYMAKLAEEGVVFTNARAAITHSTKVLFSILTGRFSSATQDIVETVPAARPYAATASIVRNKLNYRTGYFMSARGEFECGAGLAYNVGFEKFWARENNKDKNGYLGYMASDEFLMLEPMTEWMKESNKPFCLTVICSVSHDPYDLPSWYGQAAKTPLEKYQQTIRYTDKFIEAIGQKIDELHLRGNTIFCVISDHAEGFGEHGQFAHERIAFEEALHIPWVIRAPGLIESGKKVTHPVSSMDVTPTLLKLLGFDVKDAGFDGIDVLGTITPGREVYFAGWLLESPSGFVKGNQKFIYDPATKIACIYDLEKDPAEINRTEISGPEAQKIAEKIATWRKKTIFVPNQNKKGQMTIFDCWKCDWNGRVSKSRYQKQ